jgi:hypothetical protein
LDASACSEASICGTIKTTLNITQSLFLPYHEGADPLAAFGGFARIRNSGNPFLFFCGFDDCRERAFVTFRKSVMPSSRIFLLPEIRLCGSAGKRIHASSASCGSELFPS